MNHYIELDRDKDGRVYLVIHTGSRNLGVQVCNFYQKIAIEKSNREKNLVQKMREAVIMYGKETQQERLISQMLAELNKLQINNVLDADLAYIEGDDLNDYLNDMTVCIEWSLMNHIAIADLLLDGIPHNMVTTTLHNYVDVQNHIVRKGAINCTNDTCLVPLNMRDGLLIIQGRENEEWNNSLPHGAGRKMSRAAAHELLNMDMYHVAMKNVYSTCVTESTLDEAPGAYNSSEALILLLTKNGFDIKERLRPIYNFKAI